MWLVETVDSHSWEDWWYIRRSHLDISQWMWWKALLWRTRHWMSWTILSLDSWVTFYFWCQLLSSFSRFTHKMSVYGPSNSSGVMSMCISNLPRALRYIFAICFQTLLMPLTRYCAENLLIGFMTPGPTEPSGSQPQHYMKLIVDDLLNLYENSVVYRTPAFPQGMSLIVVDTTLTNLNTSQGRLVCVALLSVICDHPAMCKVGGFADHSHNEAPCCNCHVNQASIFSDESLRNGAVPFTWFYHDLTS